MSPLTQAVVAALSMSDETKPITTEELLTSYLTAAELRRRFNSCPEHLFSTDDLDIKAS